MVVCIGLINTVKLYVDNYAVRSKMIIQWYHVVLKFTRTSILKDYVFPSLICKNTMQSRSTVQLWLDIGKEKYYISTNKTIKIGLDSFRFPGFTCCVNGQHQSIEKREFSIVRYMIRGSRS